MKIPFTILETGLLDSPDFQNLSPRARLLFIDVIATGKATNAMGLFDPAKSKPFRFHPHMARGPIDRGQFYDHIRTFEEVGLIDITRAPRSGLPQSLRLNGAYAQALKPQPYQLHGGGSEPPMAVAQSHRPLKDSTLGKTNISVALHIPTLQSTAADTALARAAQPTDKDEQLDEDLADIPNRIAQWAQGQAITEIGIVKMAEDLKREAWGRYRRRQDNRQHQHLDVGELIEDLRKSAAVTTAVRKARIVQDIVKAVGDVSSLNNWRLLVHRMTRSAPGLDALLRIVYDFIDSLDRADPRATPPDSPGAALNALLRAECTRQAIDLSPRPSSGAHADRREPPI